MPATFSFADASKPASSTSAGPAPAPAAPARFSFADAAKAAPKEQDSGYRRALSEARKDDQGDEASGAVYQGLTFGYGDEIDAAVTRGLVATENLGRRALGKPLPYTSEEAGNAVEQAEREKQAAFGAKHPIMQMALEMGGSYINPLTRLGGGAAGPASGPVKKAVVSALTNAGLGGIAGAGSSEGGLKERVAGAERGAITGGIVGAGLEAASPIIGSGMRAIGNMIHHGGDASKAVVAKLQEAMEKDGLTGPAAQATIKHWLDSGLPQPEFINIAGPNVRALIRAAGVKFGEARTKVVDHLEDVQENLRNRAQGRAAQITSETRSATELRDHLAGSRDSLADTQYAEPYSQPVKVSPEVLKAVADPEGQQAIRWAIREARARQDYESVKDLTTLMQGVPKIDPRLSQKARDQIIDKVLQPVSARSLDRIRIAFRDLGRAAYRQGHKGVGGGYAGRADQIDTALDNVSGLKEARKTYHDHQAQIEALNYGQGVRVDLDGVPHQVSGTGVLNAPADSFARRVAKMSPEAKGAAQVGARQAIIDAMDKGPTALPSLKRMAYDSQAKKNLTSLFGKETADRYVSAAKLEYNRVKTANFLSPEQGSKTADVAAHAPNIFQMHYWMHNPALAAVYSMLHGGGGLSDAERQALVHLGLSPASSTMRKVSAVPKPTGIPQAVQDRAKAAASVTAAQRVAGQQ